MHAWPLAWVDNCLILSRDMRCCSWFFFSHLLVWGIGFHLAALAGLELEQYVDETGLEPPTSVSRILGLQVTAENIFRFGRVVRGKKRKTPLFPYLKIMPWNCNSLFLLELCILFSGWVFCLHVHLYTTHILGPCRGQKRGTAFPGTEITDVGAGNPSWAFGEVKESS